MIKIKTFPLTIRNLKIINDYSKKNVCRLIFSSSWEVISYQAKVLMWNVLNILKILSAEWNESAHTNFHLWLIEIPRLSSWDALYSSQLSQLSSNEKHDFKRIFSSWQKDEKDEYFLSQKISPWWYFYTRSTLSNFTNIPHKQQEQLQIYKVLNKILQEYNLQTWPPLLPLSSDYFWCICFDAISAETPIDIPLLWWFIQTRDFLASWVRLWIAWTHLWVDLWWYWWGDGPSDCNSLGFCIKL